MKSKTTHFSDANCTFCGKNENQVAIMIDADNGSICNECVTVCNEILQEETAMAPKATSKKAAKKKPAAKKAKKAAAKPAKKSAKKKK